jgi:hypothetical protein
MEVLKPPQQLDLHTGNVAETWRKWRNQFKVYFDACELSKKEGATQCAIFLHAAGPEAMEVAETFQWAEGEDPKDVRQLMAKFETHCEPQKNIVFERYQFWSRGQHDGESVDTWITELRKMAKRCEFTEEESMLRDKMVFGVRDVAMKERLLREPKLTLARALELCRAAEASREQVRTMTASGTAVSSDTHVDVLRKYPRGGNKRQPDRFKQHSDCFKQQSTERINSCRFCGRNHDRGKCPAYGKRCRTCGGRNHFDSVCESRQSSSGKAGKHANFDSKFKKRSQHSKQVNQIDEYDSDAEQLDVNLVRNGLFIGTLGNSHTDKWQDLLIVNGVKCVFKLDTGADANVLPQSIVAKTGCLDDIRPTSQPLRAFGGAKIMPLGTIQLQTVCPRTQISMMITFYVTETADVPILGKVGCEQFKLVQRIFSVDTPTIPSVEHLINDYADIFTGLGKFEEPYRITVDPAVKPVIQPCRKVPFSKQSQLKEI